MRKGVATPETNKGKKLVIPARTVSVLEAYAALNMGHSIDVMAGYYEKEGILQPDFFMMDRINKLHALSGYREQLKEAKAKYESQEAEWTRLQEKEKFDALVEQEIQNRLNNEKPKE